MSAPGAFGARLKAEREARGVGLEELSRATKVRRVLLEALEAERWGEMPSRVFVVGYLRAIAEHLHTDPAALQRALEEAWPSQEVPDVVVPRAAGEEAERPAGLRWAWAAVAFLGVAAGIGAWWYLRPVPPPAPPSAPPGAAAMTAEAAPATPDASVSGLGEGATVPSEPAPAAPDAGTLAPAPAPLSVAPPTVAFPAAPGPESREVTASVPAPPPAAAPTPHGDLWIEVSAPCWMELFSGERRLVYRQVQAGERLSFDGRAFNLTVGDAAACRVLWKGSPVNLPAETGKVVRDLALGEATP